MKKILYAEDEYTNRKLLEIRLKSMGVDCDLAKDGRKALELYRENSYDLVILDQYMPGLNGDKVAVEIRKSEPKMPIIGITSDDAARNYLLESGFNEVFIKPLRGQNYIGIIRKYIE